MNLISNKEIIYKEVDGSNLDELKKIYDYFIASCDNVSLSLEYFLEYRNGIYIAYYNEYDKDIIGILGVKRVYTKDIEVLDLPYHCQSLDTIYYIGFLHCLNPEIMDDEKSNVLKNLIDTALISRNDSHVFIETDVCPEDTILYNSNFKKYISGSRDIFIRLPITQSNGYKK